MATLWSRLSRESIATRLFLSAFFWCAVILVVAGIILSTVYRRISERAFDERLQVYLTDLASDLVAPGDFEGKEIGPGESQFKLPLSGWYWQVESRRQHGDWRHAHVALPGRRAAQVAKRIWHQGGTRRFS